MNGPREETDDIRGRVLRFLITRELQRERRAMTVKEIIARLEGYGFTILGRASKTVSDSLRWEIAKGRVVRIRRGLNTKTKKTIRPDHGGTTVGYGESKPLLDRHRCVPFASEHKLTSFLIGIV
jgi:hypothetical protein